MGQARRLEEKEKTEQMKEGWICPRCGRIWSPDVVECAPCNHPSLTPQEAKETVADNTDQTMWFLDDDYFLNIAGVA